MNCLETSLLLEQVQKCKDFQVLQSLAPRHKRRRYTSAGTIADWFNGWRVVAPLRPENDSALVGVGRYAAELRDQTRFSW